MKLTDIKITPVNIISTILALDIMIEISMFISVGFIQIFFLTTTLMIAYIFLTMKIIPEMWRDEDVNN